MKMGRKLFGLVIMVVGLLTIFPASAMAANKGYTISSGNTTVYSNAALTKKYGTIYGSDEVIIHSYDREKNRYVKVTYPTSKGSKTGYVHFSAIMTTSSAHAYKAKSKTTTYRRPGGKTYGYISAGDRVVVLGERGSYTQVYYPVSGGYKFAFVTNSDLNSKIIGDNYVNVENGTYFFTSAVKDGMVMDVYKAQTANGTNIILYQNNDDGNQKFTVTALGSGWYKILCAANGKSIDVAGGSSQSGTNVQLYEYNGSYAQQWRFYSAGNGYYYIKNRLGNWLDVNNASSATETNIQVWEKNTTNAQKWKLIKTQYNPQPAPTTYYVIANPSLILRSRASVLSLKLASMPYGSAFSVISKTNGWAYGTYNGIKGYASDQYLSPVKPSRINLSQALYNSSSAYITCGFDGYTSTKGRHEGIDIKKSKGSPFYALADGEITRITYGKNGSNGLSTIAVYNAEYNKTIIYLHSAPSSGLYVGKKISKGTKLGTESWRGISSSSASHTHVEVRDGRKTAACKSVNDYKLENSDPTSFWNSLGYNVK